MQQESCVRCLNLQDIHKPAYVDPITKTVFATCLQCQRDTQLGQYRKRLDAVGDEFWVPL